MLRNELDVFPLKLEYDAVWVQLDTSVVEVVAFRCAFVTHFDKIEIFSAHCPLDLVLQLNYGTTVRSHSDSHLICPLDPRVVIVNDRLWGWLNHKDPNDL